MAENKVQFNVKNVHIAVQSGSTWAAPIPVPACVTLTLDKEASITPFYADGIVYYNSVSNNGYTGSVEVARIPDAVLTAIWGFTLTSTSKIMQEDATIEPKNFALLFETDGDVQSEKFVFYNCSATAPSLSASTNTESKEPQTQTIELSAIPMSSGLVFSRTTDTTPTSVSSAWFTSVTTN